MNRPKGFGIIVLALAAAMLFGIAAASHAMDQTWYVRFLDQPRTENGTSWATAYSKLQDALDAASYGDQVWVAEGGYGTATTSAQCFYLKPGVKLYGGFGGTETQLSQQDFRTHRTVLYGVGGGSNVLIADENTRVDGLTFMWEDVGVYTWGNPVICNNTFNGLCQGIYCEGGSPHVYCNRFYATNNGLLCDGYCYTTAHHNVFQGCDNAVVLWYNAEPDIVNNTIIGNDRGIVMSGCDSRTTIGNNIVAFNTTAGIVGTDGSAPTLSHNCVYANGSDANYVDLSPGTGDISSNPAFSTGSFRIPYGSPCRFAGDGSLAGAGDPDPDGNEPYGGFSIGAYQYVAPSTPTVWYVAPSGDPRTEDGTSWATAFSTLPDALEAASYGDEIWVAAGTYSTSGLSIPSFYLKAGVSLYGGFDLSDVQLTDRDWVTNITTLSGIGGGGTVVVAGENSRVDGFTFTNEDLGIDTCENVAILNNTFAASLSMGVYNEMGCPILAYNKFSGSYTGLMCEGGTSALAYSNIFEDCGDAIMLGSWDKSSIVDNTIVANGRGLVIDGQGYSFSAIVGNNIIVSNTTAGIQGTNAAPSLLHNCVYGNGSDYIGVTAGSTDISGDPGFLSGGYHLDSDSPCRDAGISCLFGALDPDFDGNARNSAPDIGAYEYVP